METRNFSLQIPSPCQQSWSNMTPVDRGRHCEACSLVVVDFTKMNLEEVKSYFHSNCGKKICGRFREDQVEGTDRSGKMPLYRRLLNKRPRYRLASVFLWIASVVLLAGCMAQRKKHIIGDVAPIESPTNDSTPVK